MALRSTSDSPSIFQDGKLKPGIYKIQNIETETYLDVEVHLREVCCRPAENLGEGRGFWEIKSFGAGYTVKVADVEPGRPEQFCTSAEKLGDAPLTVAPYPVAWRIEVVDTDKHRGFEYVRFCWGSSNWAWSLAGASKVNGTKVWPWPDPACIPRRIWKLIPVRAENMFAPSQSLPAGSGSLPPYDGDTAGQSSVCTQHVESEKDEFGTIVNEVTVVTTTSTSTVTTRKKYRVEDA